MAEQEWKISKRKDGVSVGHRCESGSNTLAGVLSGQTRRGHFGFHLRPTQICSEAEEERPVWRRCSEVGTARTGEDCGDRCVWRPPSAKWPPLAPFYPSVHCVTRVEDRCSAVGNQ